MAVGETGAMDTLDTILDLQCRVAWAGETPSDGPRLGWWRTDLLDPDSGGDFVARLARRSGAWAGLQAVREAARQADHKLRLRLADPDKVRTLFFWGFELDEQLSDRLRERKWAEGEAPALASFERDQLEREFKALAPAAAYTIQASGRQMSGAMPEDPLRAAQMLVAALAPLGESYPMPFFRVP